MGKTSIEWTDASWNPIVGCTEISPGCANCYAARLSASRLAHLPAYKGLATIQTDNKVGGGCSRHVRWNGEVRPLPERFDEPLHHQRPRRIFVCDMGDLFHESVPSGNIMVVWGIMAECRARGINHTFQILTKRPARMREFLSTQGLIDRFQRFHDGKWPLPNVWLGVSVENQHFADERIPLLLQTPAALRFISAEPLLGPVDLQAKVKESIGTPAYRLANDWVKCLDWVIAGGESGPHARPMHPSWVQSLRNQCQAASVPFFFKQWGEFAPAGTVPSQKTFRGVTIGEQVMLRYGKKRSGRMLYGKEWNEFPDTH
jgi:protein gp37